MVEPSRARLPARVFSRDFSQAGFDLIQAKRKWPIQELPSQQGSFTFDSAVTPQPQPVFAPTGWF